MFSLGVRCFHLGYVVFFSEMSGSWSFSVFVEGVRANGCEVVGLKGVERNGEGIKNRRLCWLAGIHMVLKADVSLHLFGGCLQMIVQSAAHGYREGRRGMRVIVDNVGKEK
jgi:hypothetical protein